VKSTMWALIVVTVWFSLNLAGTIANRTRTRVGRFVWMRQSGDVPVQSSRSRSETRTSGEIVVHQPKWLTAPARALNNMRAQAPYLAAVMALAWWIERMDFG